MEERLEEEVVQLVRGSKVHGEHAQHQDVFSGGGGFGLTTETAIPATSYPGELGIGTVVTRGGFGWRESVRGRLGCANLGRRSERLGGCDSGEVWLLRARGWGRGC